MLPSAKCDKVWDLEKPAQRPAISSAAKPAIAHVTWQVVAGRGIALAHCVQWCGLERVLPPAAPVFHCPLLACALSTPPSEVSWVPSYHRLSTWLMASLGNQPLSGPSLIPSTTGPMPGQWFVNADMVQCSAQACRRSRVHSRCPRQMCRPHCIAHGGCPFHFEGQLSATQVKKLAVPFASSTLGLGTLGPAQEVPVDVQPVGGSNSSGASPIFEFCVQHLIDLQKARIFLNKYLYRHHQIFLSDSRLLQHFWMEEPTLPCSLNRIATAHDIPRLQHR